MSAGFLPARLRRAANAAERASGNKGSGGNGRRRHGADRELDNGGFAAKKLLLADVEKDIEATLTESAFDLLHVFYLIEVGHLKNGLACVVSAAPIMGIAGYVNETREIGMSCKKVGDGFERGGMELVSYAVSAASGGALFAGLKEFGLRFGESEDLAL